MKTLVLVVDIDDDLGAKAKVKGPLIGEKKLIEAAKKLGLSDPEDADTNAIFKAVKLYKEMKAKGRNVEVALLTGSKKLGMHATQRVAQQLDVVVKKVGADSAVLVSDGIADEVVLPLIESRLKLSGVDIVYVKQAKELEKTYFLILEKLKDPYYAKIIFGVPAVILILLSLMDLFNIPWQFLGFMVGLYLIIKGFGFEDTLYSFISSSIEVHESIRTLVFVVLILFFATALGISYMQYLEVVEAGESNVIGYLSALDVLVNFFTLFIVGAFILRIFYNYTSHNTFRMLSSLNTFVSTLAIIVVVKVTLRWIINAEPPYFGFGDVIKITLAVIFVSYMFYRYIDGLMRTTLSNSDLKGFEVYNRYGDFLGIVEKTSQEDLLLKTKKKKKEKLSLKRVVDVFPNRVVVR